MIQQLPIIKLPILLKDSMPHLTVANAEYPMPLFLDHFSSFRQVLSSVFNCIMWWGSWLLSKKTNFVLEKRIAYWSGTFWLIITDNEMGTIILLIVCTFVDWRQYSTWIRTAAFVLHRGNFLQPLISTMKIL